MMSGDSQVLMLHDCDRADALVYAVEAGGRKRYDTTQIAPVGPSAGVEWLWPGRIPRRMVTVIEGGSGSGKTWVALDLARRAANRLAWPNGTPHDLPAADVLVVSRQNEAGRIGADFNKPGERQLCRFGGFATHDPEHKLNDDGYSDRQRPIAFPLDLEALDFHLELKPAIGVVVIDSLPDFCATPKQFAETMLELNRIADRHHIALIVTVPANCRTTAEGRLRVASKWNTDGARCVWSILQDPNQPARRIFVPRRTNYGLEPQGMSFRIDKTGVVWDAGSSINPLDPLGELAAIDRFLDDFLRFGPTESAEILREGGERGFSVRQLRAGGQRLGAICARMGYGGDGNWQWTYPDHPLAVDIALANSEAAGTASEKAPAAIPDDRAEFEKGWEAPQGGDEPAVKPSAAVTAIAQTPIMVPVATPAATSERKPDEPGRAATDSCYREK